MDIKVGNYVEDRNGNIGYIVNVYPWNGFSYELSRDKEANLRFVFLEGEFR